jgi:aryl-alcohol dehydrogenase-like predicted oxidoreductase
MLVGVDYRTFGRSGLRISDLVLGAMNFDDDLDCRAIFDAYAEAGGNVIDTANRYTGGRSEQIVGDLVASDRDRFVLSTKYTLALDDTDPNSAGNHPASLRRSLERSLRSLGTDRIDLFWVHIWDPLTPIEETMRALDDAVRAGKVLYVGASDVPAWVVARANTLAELRGWSPFVGLQMPYSLARRDIEREILPMADGLGLSVTAWSPLAGGALTRDGTEIAATVRAVADELGATPAQVALAWLLARQAVHPIIGASRADQVRDNLGAPALRLPDGARERLDRVSAIELGFPADFVMHPAGPMFGAARGRISPART